MAIEETKATTEEIMADFEDLFGGEDPEGGEGDNTKTENPDKPEVDDPKEDDPNGEGKVEDEKGEEEKPASSVKKQAETFYKMRKEVAENKALIKNLSKALGFEEDVDPETLTGKIQELALKKEAQASNAPVELLERINSLEAALQEKNEKEFEQQIVGDLEVVAEKFDLDEKALTDFLQQLAAEGKNALEMKGIDFEAEYLKHNYEKLVEQKVEAALEADRKRKEDAAQTAPGGLPGKTGGDSQVEHKIETVAELDKLFDNLGS